MINVGIIGLGRMGLIRLQEISKLNFAKVVKVYDPNNNSKLSNASSPLRAKPSVAEILNFMFFKDHGIAIRQESIFFFDCKLVKINHFFITNKGCN